MKNYKNIYIQGTSHISRTSIVDVRRNIDSLDPEIIALELDPGRAQSLLKKTRRPKNIELLKALGLGGFLFYIFGEFIQKKFGKILNISPGSEMKAALKESILRKKRIALIDRDIQITLRAFSTRFKKREVLKMLWDIISSPLKREKVEFDMKDVPSEEVIEKVISETKKRYPSFYSILVDERDKHMARALFILSRDNPEKKIFSVVGAGHMKGILRYLEKNFKEYEESAKNKD